MKHFFFSFTVYVLLQIDLKGHSFCKQCLHDLQFMKTMSSSPNLSKLARADISCQFMKTRSLCRHCLQNDWTLVRSSVIRGFMIFKRASWSPFSIKCLLSLNDWLIFLLFLVFRGALALAAQPF